MSKGLLKKVIAGLTLAGVLFGTGVVPAFAEVKVGVSKTVTTEQGVPAPTEEYTFDLAAAEVPAGKTAQDGKINVYPGVIPQGYETEKGISLDRETTTASLGEDNMFSFDEMGYDKPGIYRYMITENPGHTPGMVYDDTIYYVDVYVESSWDAEQGAEVLTPVNVLTYREADIRDGADYTPAEVDNDAEGVAFIKEPPAFNNDYTAGQFSVSKQVTGSQADYNYQFNFDLFVYEDEDGRYPAGYLYDAVITRKDGSQETVVVTVVADGSVAPSATFALAHGDTLNISGLPTGIAYKVAEKLDTAAEKSYDTTVTSAAAAAEQQATSLNGTMPAEGETVTFTNKRDSEVPTGVILGVMPFAGALVISACLLAVKLKKKSESAAA